MRHFDLILENVRCFFGRHTIPIRPLTFLIGENSSGKTTAMAMISALTTKGQFPASPLFNSEIYKFGAFESIASNSKGSQSRIFSFGVRFPSEGKFQPIEVFARYRSDSGVPTLHNCSFIGFDPDFRINGAPSMRLSIDGIRTVRQVRPLTSKFPDPSLNPDGFMQVLRAKVNDNLTAKQMENNDWWTVWTYFRQFTSTSTYSIAPVRSKPLRTYENINLIYDPEGGHIPLLLAKISEKSSIYDFERFSNALCRFGDESGLFSKVEHRRLGRTKGAPFQIEVRINGTSRNLLDVGYGVSQSLPILVEALLAEQKRRLLIQQPEIHLHPRAQSALGSLFAEMTAKHQKTFVIETHSDYILDRVRMEVAKKRIKPEDVIFLYFERKGAEAKVYPIHLDDMGNIVDAPSSYRQFFTDEMMRVLSRGDDVSHR